MSSHSLPPASKAQNNVTSDVNRASFETVDNSYTLRYSSPCSWASLDGQIFHSGSSSQQGLHANGSKRLGSRASEAHTQSPVTLQDLSDSFRSPWVSRYSTVAAIIKTAKYNLKLEGLQHETLCTQLARDITGPSTSKHILERIQLTGEFYKGECEHLYDLITAVKCYMEPLRLLRILDPNELHQVFYTIDRLLTIFEDLVIRLSQAIESSAGVPPIAQVFLEWLNFRHLRTLSENSSSTNWGTLSTTSSEPKTVFSFNTELIIDYVAHLFEAREYFEALKRHRKEFSDFLSRCRTASFNRRLDLWHFLDCTRTRFIRYSLLFNRLLNLLPEDDAERFSVCTVIRVIEHKTAELNQRVGEAQCLFHLKRIQLNRSCEYRNVIFRQKELLLSGELRVGQTKVKAFLLPEVLLLTVPLSNSSQQRRFRSLLRVLTVARSCSTSEDHSNVSTLLRQGYSDCKARPRWLLSATTDSPRKDNVIHSPCISTSFYEFSCTDDEFSLVPPYITRYRLLGDAIVLKDFILDSGFSPSKALPFPAKRLADNVFQLRLKTGSKTVKRSSVNNDSLPVFRSASGRIRFFTLARRLDRRGTSPAAFDRIPDPSPTEVLVFKTNGPVEKNLWLSSLRPLMGAVVSGVDAAECQV